MRPILWKDRFKVWPLFTDNKRAKLEHVAKRGDLEGLVSYGGFQSNAMSAIARVANEKKIEFVYYTHPIPSWLRENPIGNYKIASDLGTKFKEVPREVELRRAVVSRIDESKFTYIPRGGSTIDAIDGMKILAKSVSKFRRRTCPEGTAVLVASGTGTTALLLQHWLRDIDVFCVPCVSTAKHLHEQFDDILSAPKSTKNIDDVPSRFPFVLDRDMSSDFPFGQPKKRLLETFLDVKDTADLELDLLYGAPTWHMAFADRNVASGSPSKWRRRKKKSRSEEHEGPLLSLPEHVIYVHCGGLEGNETQLRRYMRLGLL